MQEAHSHNASIVLFFRPQKLGGLFSLHQSVFDAIFHFNSTFALLTQKNAAGSVLGALKSILDRHLDLFVFLEAKMQGYNRAPLFDRLNSYNQIAFFVQFGDGWLDYHLIQVLELLIFIFNSKHGSEIIDSYRSVTGAAELLEQLVNADAVGAGKAGDVLHDYPRKLPLELCQIRHDGIGEGDIYFRLTFEILRPVLHPAELFSFFLVLDDY